MNKEVSEKSSIRDLIAQAKNTRYFVYEIAAAYLGVPAEQVLLTVKEPENSDKSENCT